MSSPLKVETDSEELGFDPARLTRIDDHFARYVDDGRLAGWHIVVARDGKVVHSSTAGQRDVEAGLPVTDDTRWRIYSMSKPITSVAALMLWERGAFELTDPISRWLPEFAEPKVYVKGSSGKPLLEAATEPIRVWHLLTHTAGLTYGFHHAHPVDELYRAAGFEWSVPAGLDLAGCVEAWARMPLVFQPGSEWNYSHATDVLGRLIEVVSGQALDAFLDEHVLGPLGMTATGFVVDDPDQLAALYVQNPATGRALLAETAGMGAMAREVLEPTWLGGGGGLVSTAADYHRFTQMLLGRGEVDGVRLLGSRTVDYMGRNHLPGGLDLEQVGRPLFAEMPFDGVGFGLGVAVVTDPVRYRTPASVGEMSWGGAASTAFWVDPAERITAMFMTQLLPSSAHPIRTQLRGLVYQALVD
ncbi:CubicO group peptidase (beta-lactamase class C family) [Actinomycetospora succinea]|uniref:CubicO group peptidase (Beta-lactamase class C family) n=1 Tax=Actinomycetospora succinea TaxID=663603 RepID=A0A4R6UZN5_9PSEU|nr:serine hydrolase domain-containing protein [Actinomycetospora succinea]TDQ52845.1 CubicO group peptidase (beta-lactamase class C family) [Actinomycetospora succinea]